MLSMNMLKNIICVVVLFCHVSLLCTHVLASGVATVGPSGALAPPSASVAPPSANQFIT